MRLPGVRSTVVVIGALIALVALSDGASAKFKVLYDFCSQENCADGGRPNIGLTSDGQGNFYGITSTGGGSSNSGTIFKLAHVGESYEYEVLYAIDCDTNCPDGSSPTGELVLDTAGNLYGVMKSPYGRLFELTTDGKYSVIYNFCSGNCSDSGYPTTPLTYVGQDLGELYDHVSPLYGAAGFGGLYGSGTVYSFTPGSGEQVLYSFCQPSKCKSGATPLGGVGINSLGTLYGVNRGNTRHPGGLVWSVAPDGVLHHFCDAKPCKDGRTPTGGLSLDSESPMIFGTTEYGGAGDLGVAYELDLSTNKYSLLHTFCKSGSQPCRDGMFPNSPPYPDHAGGVIGTSPYGGNITQTGSLYRIDLATKRFRVLHGFCAQPGCTDGVGPAGRAVQYGGSIFGVTTAGGSASSFAGTIYQYTP